MAELVVKLLEKHRLARLNRRLAKVLGTPHFRAIRLSSADPTRGAVRPFLTKP